MDRFRIGNDCFKVPQNDILHGMVGFYISSWYPLNFPPQSFDLFPGTFALCSAQLGKELSHPFFSIVATMVTVCVVLLWMLVAVMTVLEGWQGKIFYAPCLASVADPNPESSNSNMTVTSSGVSYTESRE